MKKQLVLIFFLLIIADISYSQKTKVNEVIDQLKNTYNQFNDRFDPGSLDEKFTLIFIPGTNDPFGKFYNKYSGKHLKKNVHCIGGFKEMMVKMDEHVKVSHLQDALKSRFKDKDFNILIDSKSRIQEILSLNGYAIITISKKSKKIISNENFGLDRAAFFKALKSYIKQ